MYSLVRHHLAITRRFVTACAVPNYSLQMEKICEIYQQNFRFSVATNAGMKNQLLTFHIHMLWGVTQSSMKALRVYLYFSRCVCIFHSICQIFHSSFTYFCNSLLISYLLYRRCTPYMGSFSCGDVLSASVSENSD